MAGTHEPQLDPPFLRVVADQLDISAIRPDRWSDLLDDRLDLLQHRRQAVILPDKSRCCASWKLALAIYRGVARRSTCCAAKMAGLKVLRSNKKRVILRRVEILAASG